MPQPLRPGLYDRVIDRRLRRLIDALDEGIRSDEAELDTADVPDRMSRLFAEAIRAGLASLPHGGRRTTLLERLRQGLAGADPLLTPGELELEAERDRPLRLLEPLGLFLAFEVCCGWCARCPRTDS